MSLPMCPFVRQHHFHQDSAGVRLRVRGRETSAMMRLALPARLGGRPSTRGALCASRRSWAAAWAPRARVGAACPRACARQRAARVAQRAGARLPDAVRTHSERALGAGRARGVGSGAHAQLCALWCVSAIGIPLLNISQSRQGMTHRRSTR
eukprot:6209422-Pleurochrysis_carterae.AAC.4